MKLARHYIRLREHFAPLSEAAEVDITLDELGEILECTNRNVGLVLKRMADNSWLQWKPRRGRGNRSGLTFLIAKEEVMLRLAKEFVKRRDLRSAMELMNLSTISPAIKQNFNDWLHHSFGYSTELKDRKKIDTLRFPLSQPFYSLDPVHINFASESHLVNQVFDSLIRHNHLTQTIEPCLAHAWEVDRSNKCWTFYLRKGVLFHHGREMSAHDVVYSLNRLRTSTARTLYRWMNEQIEQIGIIDPTTIRIHLLTTNELLLPFLGTSRASIVPEDICHDSLERFGKNPIGTGPFKVVTNNPSMCVLEAFPHYFQGRAHLDRVEIWNIPELYDQEHQKGLDNFQIIHNYRLPDEATSQWNQVQQQGTTCKFIAFNVLPGLLSNVGLRQAIYHSVDRQQIIDELAGDVIYPADGFITKTSTTKVRLSEEDAADLLKQAGYQGEILTLCTIPHYEHDAKLVQAAYERIGIQVQVNLLPIEEFKGEARLQADLILFAVMLDNDVELRLIDLYQSMQHHLQPEVNSLLEEKISAIIKEPSQSKRTALFVDIEQHLTAHCSLLFLYQKHLKTVYHPSVNGISLDSLGWVQFKDIWFKS